MEEQPSSSGEAPKPAPKSKALWIVIAVVVVVVVVLLAAVLGGLFGPSEERVLKIGTVLSITGGLAAFGPNNQKGVKLALSEINAAGGVLGQPVQEFDQDDNTKPDTARSAATTLISQNKVDAIIGATGSGQCSTIVEVAKANSVFEISGSCTSPKFSNLTLTGGWWGRTAPSDALQGVVAARYAHSNLSWARAATVGINNAFGTGLSNVFAGNFTRFGGTVTAGSPRFLTEVQNGATDYTTDLAAVLDVSPAPQILYVVAYPPDGILLVKNYFQGIGGAHPAWANVQLLFSEGVFDQSGFLDALRTQSYDISAFQGTAPSAYGGLTGPNYAGWSASYKAKWGNNPGLFDDNNYDAAYLVALAAQKGGSATGATIKANIAAVANPPGTKIYPGEWAKALTEIAAGHDIDYEGASGSVNINSLGDPLSGYIVWAVNNTGGAYNKEIFTESYVVSLLPSPPMMALMAKAQSIPSFVVGLAARTEA